MSEIPEIEALELTVVQADTLTGERWTGEMVRWSDAESAIRSALDRQANDWDAAILTLRKACCTPAGREQIIHELVRPFDLAGDELDRQAREIVEALREMEAVARGYSIECAEELSVAADSIERRFAPKEADPHGTR